MIGETAQVHDIIDFRRDLPAWRETLILMKKAIIFIFAWMPVLFGIGFLAPLMSQVIAQSTGENWLSPWLLLPSVLVGMSWGAYAKWRGSWL